MKPFGQFAISCLVVLVCIGLLPAVGYSAADWEDVIFYYPMNEGAGNVTKQHPKAPNQFAARLENSPRWVTDDIPNTQGNKTALEFLIAKEQGLTIFDHPALDLGTGDVTLEAWAKTEIGDQDHKMIITTWGENGSGYYLKITQGLLLSRYNDINRVGPEVKSTKKVSDGKWHHLVSTRKNRTEVRMYIDGKLDVETMEGAGPGAVDPDANFYIGWQVNRPTRFFEGLIDEARIWSRALTDEEVLEAMNGAILSVESAGKLPISWGRIKSSY